MGKTIKKQENLLLTDEQNKPSVNHYWHPTYKKWYLRIKNVPKSSMSAEDKKIKRKEA